MIPQSLLITITEEGESIGTLRQFASSLNLSLARLREVLETDARDCVIFCAGWAPDRLLILDVCGLPALLAITRNGVALSTPH
jgi:hypothetical protein